MTTEERELIAETTIDDIADNYRQVAEIVGVEKFVELAALANGDEIYFPKYESVLAPARNRRIIAEWNGYNQKELAKKYGLTVMQINRILKDEVHPDQMSIFDILGDKKE
mgnify:CR=1 FL=1